MLMVKLLYAASIRERIDLQLSLGGLVDLPGEGPNMRHEHLWLKPDGSAGFLASRATKEMDVLATYAPLEDEVEIAGLWQVSRRPNPFPRGTGMRRGRRTNDADEPSLGQFFVETSYTPEAATHIQADLRQKMPVELPGRGIRNDPHEHLWITRDGGRSFAIDYAADGDELRQRYAPLEDDVEWVEVSQVMTRPRMGSGRPFYGTRRVR